MWLLIHGIIVNLCWLTHWGRVTHICVSKLTIIGSDNGLPPDRQQAIIWSNAGILLIGPLGTNFGEISIEILTFSFKKMRLKVSSAKRRPFCLGLNELKDPRPQDMMSRDKGVGYWGGKKMTLILWVFSKHFRKWLLSFFDYIFDEICS